MLDALLQRLRRVQKAQRRGGRLLWLHKGEAACGAQATLGLQGDTGDVGEMLEMLEMLEMPEMAVVAVVAVVAEM